MHNVNYSYKKHVCFSACVQEKLHWRATRWHLKWYCKRLIAGWPALFSLPMLELAEKSLEKRHNWINRNTTQHSSCSGSERQTVVLVDWHRGYQVRVFKAISRGWRFLNCFRTWFANTLDQIIALRTFL